VVLMDLQYTTAVVEPCRNQEIHPRYGEADIGRG
jgi:hypothetical protein